MTYLQRKRRILILGGGYAGLIAAARSARAGSAEITLVNARPEFVQRIRLHEALAGSSPRTLALAPALARRGVRFVQGFVEQLQPDRQRVVGRDSAGNRLELGYDELIVALGSRTAAPTPDVAAHTVRLDDQAAAQAASEQIRQVARRGGRVLIVGAGLTGIETAAELAERFPTLRVGLTTNGRIGEGYSAEGEHYLRQRLARLGIEVWEQTPITGVEQGHAWTASGTVLPFDMCVWCGGFEAPPLAREAGLQVDSDGRVVVDAVLRAVDQPNIFAVGDAAAITVGGKTIRMACASALPMGGHVGDNIRRLLRGAELKPFDLGFAARCISLGRRDGLVQWTTLDDTARPKIWTQRRAVYSKELICRATYTIVAQELRLGIPLYHWVGSGKAQGEIGQAAGRAQEISA
ncbi:MAG TPA: FAD-dependent oxidoreductase [Herpetosiphonaceae bacterium]